MNELRNMSVTSGDAGGVSNYTGGKYSGGGLQNCNIQWIPATQQWNGFPSYQTIYTTVAPTECSGDVHVFPCAKCGECKCGRAEFAKPSK